MVLFKILVTYGKTITRINQEQISYISDKTHDQKLQTYRDSNVLGHKGLRLTLVIRNGWSCS